MDVLTDMAQTGGVGVLKPGASLDGVSDVLGPAAEADYFPQARPSWPRTFRYGDIRLEVCRCRLIHRVALSTWTESVEIPTTSAGVTESVSPTTTFAQLRDAFDLAGVGWELDPELDSATQFTVVVDREPVLVRFTFHCEAGSFAVGRSGATLHSAISRDDAHMCP
ncbi:hypothetical protein FBY35_2211 [Streptomyces sp. SLBN-118]|nr:hypothetical protein FBY35_2211 [Streptomyces sp. SLBN-118]